MNRFQKLQDTIDQLENGTIGEATTRYRQALSSSRDILRRYADEYGSLEIDILRQNNVLGQLENELVKEAEQVRGEISGLTRSVLRDTYTTAYNETIFYVNNLVDRDLENAFARETMEEVINTPVGGIPLNQRLDINRSAFVNDVINTVESGLREGLPYAEMSRKLRERYEVDINSAQRVIRTEGHRVQEAAKKESIDDLEEQGIETKKYWLTSRDSRVRPSHQSLGRKYDDNNAIPKDEPFRIRGYTAQYASDFGVAEMDINCRCVVAYTVTE